MEDLTHWAHPLQPDCLECHKNRDVEKLQGQEEPFCWFSSSAFLYVSDLRWLLQNALSGSETLLVHMTPTFWCPDVKTIS